MRRRAALGALFAGAVAGRAGPVRAQSPFTPDIPVPGAGKLPLVELAVPRPAGDAFAVIVSGDGGWRDIDRSIGRVLQSRGVPVLGWDALSYFWRRRGPDEFARDLGAAIEAYSERWGTPRVALVGYSFGADVLPHAYNRLPAGSRARVALMALLGLGRGADFQISLRGYLGLSGPDATPTEPEVRAIEPGLIQCIYGGTEAAASGCQALAGSAAELVRTPGGHHFGGDYAALAERILDGLRRRGAMR